jgi:Ca2+-transporting ATPase
MTRPPRKSAEPLFNRRVIGLSLLQGLSVFIIVLAVYGISLSRGQGEGEARALTFTTLIIANLGLILTNRSWTQTIIAMLRSPNGALWSVLGSTFFFLGMALSFPFMRRLFHFDRLHATDIVICLAAGIVSILWFELFKVINRAPA